MFGSQMAVPSLADIAAVTGNRNNDGFGDGGWWAWILFAIIFGWGGNGYGWGNNGGGGNQFTEAAIQRGFDNQAVINKLDGISNGICSLGYDQLSQMNNLGTTVMQTGFGLQQAINADTVANMQNTNALSRQLSECCCENREAIAQLRYDDATNTCNIINNMNNGFRNLGDQVQAGFNQLILNQKDQQIAELQNQLNICNRDSALQGTASYIINSIRPTPIPTWDIGGNPWANCGCSGYNNNNCNSCCNR